MDTSTDQELIRRVRAGETRPYAELVDRHKDKAMTVAIRMLKNREDAEEAVQDAFVRAYRALDRFEERAKFSTWLYRILFNVCSTALSKRGKVPLQDSQDERDDSGDAEIPDVGEIPDAIFEEREFKESVVAALNDLPPLYSGILSMFLLDELSYEEIVNITGLPLGTVKARLFRARTMLRNAVLQVMDFKEVAR